MLNENILFIFFDDKLLFNFECKYSLITLIWLNIKINTNVLNFSLFYFIFFLQLLFNYFFLFHSRNRYLLVVYQ
jgi:hypothetical protein